VKKLLVAVVLALTAPLWGAEPVAGVQRFEFSADAFQHMDRWNPMAKVPKGSTPSELPRGAPIAGVDLDAFNVANDSMGMVVVHRGKIRYENYWHGADETTHFTSWSVAKSFTSTLIGIAYGSGAIAKLEDPVVKYVPELASSAYKDVTVEQALQMSSGVKFIEDYSVPQSDIARFVNEGVSPGKANQWLTTLTEKAAPPGTKFNYNSAETQVLGWIVKNATGQSPSKLLSDRIWQRAGMEDDAEWVLDAPNGMEVTGMGINARLRDYARFGLLMLNDGVHEGTRVLPAGWAERATKPSAPSVQIGNLYEGAPLGYQYQWWVRSPTQFEAEGVYGQFIYVDRDHDLVIAKTSIWPEAWVVERHAAFWAVADAIVAALEKERG
jgi:CubicO group peptidase (beta-lactamase class C family)